MALFQYITFIITLYGSPTYNWNFTKVYSVRSGEVSYFNSSCLIYMFNVHINVNNILCIYCMCIISVYNFENHLSRYYNLCIRAVCKMTSYRQFCILTMQEYFWGQLFQVYLCSRILNYPIQTETFVELRLKINKSSKTIFWWKLKFFLISLSYG